MPGSDGSINGLITGVTVSAIIEHDRRRMNEFVQNSWSWSSVFNPRATYCVGPEQSIDEEALTKYGIGIRCRLRRFFTN